MDARLQPPNRPENGPEWARRLLLAVELDQDELACRILEAQVGMQRPPTMTATEALETQTPEIRLQVRKAAAAAIAYLREQFNSGSSLS